MDSSIANTTPDGSQKKSTAASDVENEANRLAADQMAKEGSGVVNLTATHASLGSRSIAIRVKAAEAEAI